MNATTFNRLMEYFEYAPADRKWQSLNLVLVHGMSQAGASKATGLSSPQLSLVLRRVRREVAKIEKLTGVPLQ